MNDSQDLKKLAKAAEQARDRADRALKAAQARAPEVRRVAASLEGFEHRNRFAEMMILSYQRNK